MGLVLFMLAVGMVVGLTTRRVALEAYVLLLFVACAASVVYLYAYFRV